MKKFTKILALTLVLVMSVVLLASCAAPNKDPEKAKAALEENGYKVVLVDKTAGLIYEDLDVQITAFDDDDNAIFIYYFKNKDAANDAWDDIEKEIEELKEEAKEEDVEIVAKKSGTMIYFGTKDAVKAAK